MRPYLHLPIAGLAVVGLALSGCTSSGAPLEPMTLTMSHVDGGPELDPAVSWFVDRVAELSDDAITIDVSYECCGATAAVEEALVTAVADGTTDLGWVGTRVFGDLGLTATEPLTAPLIIDSYALQSAVIASDEAAAALEGVADLGVTPIALAPGSLRIPLAATGPLLDPADWRGLTVASFHSSQNAAAFTALGAEPVDVGFDERDAGLFDGTIQVLENSLIALDRDRESTLPYATSNVVLWPRISAIIGSEEGVSKLGAAGLAILEQAAADVATRSADLVALDAEAFASACEGGARFSAADDGQLGALEDSFAGIYDALRADDAAAPLFEAVVDLKATVEREPALAIPVECTGAPPAQGGSGGGDVGALNGSFQTVEHTVESVKAAGFSADDANGVAGKFTLTFDEGTFGLRHDAATGDEYRCDGTYVVGGDRVTITTLPGGDCGPGGRLFDSAFTVDGQQLAFTDLISSAEIDVFLFSSQPLARVG